MKFTPEVVAALEVLRSNATNDFERHRLDVLERDLKAPPTVEIVDDTTQSFDGEKFYKGKDGHLKQTTTVHQRVWRYYRGDIPEGYQIHHVDLDKANNDISNLQCLTKSAHQQIHNPKGTVNQKLKTLICVQCGKQYLGHYTNRNRFCSQQCRNEYRKTHDLTKRICAYCGKPFERYPSNDAKCCSHKCAMDLKRKHQPETRTCPVCGKSFVTAAHPDQRFCSRSCAARGRKSS